MAIKWTNKSAINREIDMAERHTDRMGMSRETALATKYQYPLGPDLEEDSGGSLLDQ